MIFWFVIDLGQFSNWKWSLIDSKSDFSTFFVFGEEGGRVLGGEIPGKGYLDVRMLGKGLLIPSIDAIGAI